jgi:DNA-binding beta-propeller fold protein YncE
MAVWVGLATGVVNVFGLQPTPMTKVELPGLRADGSVLLPNQWSLRPAGRQVDLGDFPVNIAVHPDGRFAAVLHCGHGAHEIVVVDVKEAKEVSRTPVNEAFYGLEFAHGGGRLYCSGSSDEVVHVFDFKEGRLTANQDIRLRETKWRGIPCGMAVSGDARTLYVANVWGQRVSQVDLSAKVNQLEMFFERNAAAIADLASTYEPKEAQDPDLAAVTKRAEAQFDPSTPDAPFPYACRLDERRQRLYVSLWAQASVAVIDLKTHHVLARWATGEHPNEMALTKSGRHLFVANANRNTVTVLDTLTGKAAETLYASLSPNAPPGSTPNSLALSPDETKLFVANACNNNIAVFDVSVVGKSHSLGFIPVGWYPTSVRVTPDGRQLLVANGKGLSSKANPNGPQPDKKKKEKKVEAISELFPGTLSIIDLAKGKEFTKQLAAYTVQAYECTPQHSLGQVVPSVNNPVPSAPGKTSPIKYVIYIIKENRTYDQVLGDMPKGNGDPTLCLFTERVTPNHHKIANEFVVLDNFYADAEVSADGHEWSMGAYATDFVEKSWPMNYGHNRSKKFPYPSEGHFPIADPTSGYLWDRAKEAGVSYRSYGEFVIEGKSEGQPAYTKIASLQGHFDPWYHGFDTGYPDLKRADRFIAELKRFEAEAEMPRLQIVRLPNDHTAGVATGKLTPTAYVGDNDRAFGLVVEAVSHSKFWPQTAIFVVEDDAQNGPDHVDAHRTIAFAISPYIRHGTVDSTMYSTTSMLRTMELILGLEPMTQFDTAATPMFNSFQATPDLRPYDALPTNVDLNERNTRLAWGSKAAQKMDFSKEDAADDFLLNEMIWRSVRGADSPMPAPIRAAFVFTHPKDKDDD